VDESLGPGFVSNLMLRPDPRAVLLCAMGLAGSGARTSCSSEAGAQTAVLGRAGHSGSARVRALAACPASAPNDNNLKNAVRHSLLQRSVLTKHRAKALGGMQCCLCGLGLRVCFLHEFRLVAWRFPRPFFSVFVPPSLRPGSLMSRASLKPVSAACARLAGSHCSCGVVQVQPRVRLLAMLVGRHKLDDGRVETRCRQGTFAFAAETIICRTLGTMLGPLSLRLPISRAGF